ncbi:ISAs1 family transposase [Chondrinema litorale]|uniref:ISAs1 family transposase n=1 Tax=Chondrinema litorale TaxID=2994555 RepID=UPI0025432EEB|nr:ISAs1 family transposase [Chondrinema litorale]UZR97569.1 ISAs1 family transposase [Chondrinema litorale]
MEGDKSEISKLLEWFGKVQDFRIERSKLYPLDEILFLMLSAVISGCEHWDEIADFGEEKLDWLRKYLPYDHETPSHDTLNRVMSGLDYRSFEVFFIDWASKGMSFDGKIVNLDGKKLCRSATKKEQQTPHSEGGKSAVHLVQAWCSHMQMCLGQYRTKDKSNEIVAIPSLLDLLEVEGAVITIDAMGCQKKITEKIISARADYVIGLKGNQKKLQQKTMALFCSKKEVLPSDEWNSRGHGRIEKRTCRVLSASLLDEGISSGWEKLISLIEIESERRVIATQETSTDKRYYISSLDYSAKGFNEVIRGHWAIENQLHWSLDVQFKEDSSRKRKKNAAQNYGLILRMGVNIIKASPGKISVNRKRHKCARADEYREQVMKFKF